MEWLPLTLLSAFSLATADAVTKRYLARRSARELMLTRFAATALVLAPVLVAMPFPHIPPAFWAWIAALLPLEVLAMVIYMQAIRSAPLAETLPYLAFTPVFTTVTGYLLLGEQVSPYGLAGILLVVAGAYGLNLDRAIYGRGTLAVLEPIRAIGRGRGPRLMLMVAAIYSITSVLGKGAMQLTTPAFFGPFYFVMLGVIVTVGFALASPVSLTVLWRQPGANLLMGLAMAVMVITHFLAIEHVEVAYMIAVKRSSLLFGILYGALWFHEPRALQHTSAGGIMVAGIFLIAA